MMLAFAAGILKAWILSPLGNAFNELSPNLKVVVTAVVVIAVLGAITVTQLRRKRMLLAMAERIRETYRD